jgi:AraC-like DNA-binding protein
MQKDDSILQNQIRKRGFFGMDNIRFYNSFFFTTLVFQTVHHTDRSSGVLSHHIGRMLCGTARIVTDRGETLSLKAGDIFYMPLGMRYHSYWYPDDASGTVEFESYRFDLFPTRSAQEYALQHLFPDDESLDILDRLSADKAVSCLSVGLLYAFLGHMLPTMRRMDLERDRALFSKARHYIDLHPHFRVPELAHHCAMSESSLYAFFRAYANTTPIELKNKILAEKAVTLLGTTDFPVESIAASLGLHSVAYLRKIVKAHTGKTPSAIRREQRLALRI